MRHFEDKNTSVLVGVATFLLLTLGVITFVVAQSITFDKDLDLQGTKKILNAANIGIGTTGPVGKLDVRYNSGFGITWGTTTTQKGQLDWTSDSAVVFAASGSKLGLGANGTYDKLVIDTAGNVGIGTASPSYKFDVAGTGQFNQPLIVGTPTASNHAVTKNYVDSAIVSTADMVVKGNCTGAVTVDWSAGKTQHCVLTGNVTFTFNTPQSGANYKLILKQDGIGSRTVTWPASVRWGSLGAPNLSVVPAKTDYVGFIYNGVDTSYDGVAFNSNF